MSITKTSVATSSTKVEHPGNTDAGSIIVFGPISPDFSRFPLDIVRLILEASVRHSVSGDDDNFCRRAAYAYCFISKEVKAWIEPVLYEHIVLESSNQVVGFLDALEYKSPAFLARAVKSVSVLDDSFPVNETFKFERLFSRCQSLAKLVCLGSSMRILRTISALSTVPHALRELTIIQPSSAHYLFIQHLSLQKLHIVDFCGTFLGTLNEMARKDKKLLTALRSIRQIFLDSVSVPDNYLTWELKHGTIPLLLLNAPDSGTTVSVHATWRHRKNRRLPDKYFAKDVDMWVKGFDALAEKFDHRLFVTAESPFEFVGELGILKL